MSLGVREKVSSFDRILRQRASTHLKGAEKYSLRLMEQAYDSNVTALLKRINRLKSRIAELRNSIEYGSFVSLPASRSGRRFHTTTPTRDEEEMSQMLFLGEVILLECRNLFEKLQAVDRIISIDASQVRVVFAEAENSLRRIEKLQLSRSSSEGSSLDSVISSYSENVEVLEDLVEKENLFALEKTHLSGVIAMDKGSLFSRFKSKIARKPVFEKEISDAILLVSQKLRTKTGGLVKLPALYTMIKAARPTLKISMKDVEIVVRDLEKKGVIPGLREVSGIKIVELVPVTATPDQNVILDMASQKGMLVLENVLLTTKWTRQRAARALKELEELGIAKYEVTSREWRFPAFMEDVKSKEDLKSS